MGIWQWIVTTLRSCPELAIFLALAVGFWIGPKKLAGDQVYDDIGRAVRAVARGYRQAYEAFKAKAEKPKARARKSLKTKRLAAAGA
jgi:hypothetical protein